MGDDRSVVQDWIVAYFESHARLNGRRMQELLDANYIELELLDSMGMLELLAGIEEEFGIWLEPEEMQDPRFGSVAGLSELVTEARARV